MAAAWFDHATRTDCYEILDDDEMSVAFEALQEHVWEEFDEHKRMTLDELCDAQDRLEGAIPDKELRELQFRCQEHYEEANHVRVNAAFHMGVAIGRKLGGVR